MRLQVDDSSRSCSGRLSTACAAGYAQAMQSKKYLWAGRSMGLPWACCAALVLTGFSTQSCVTEDATTGEVFPRGNQKLPFAEVEKLADQLKPGMSKMEVVMLIGSPAEKSEDESVWVYLPERYGILIPARALRLEFKDRVLADHGYRAIVLGTQL